MTNLNWWKQNGSVKLPDLDKIRYEEQQVWEWTSMKETELLRVYWQYMTKEENELLRKLFDYLYLHYDEIFKYKMYEVWYTIWLIHFKSNLTNDKGYHCMKNIFHYCF